MGGEEPTTATAAVRIPPPSIRLFALLNPTDPGSEPEPDLALELDERDVVWSSASDLSSSPSPPSAAGSLSSSPASDFRGGSSASYSSSRRSFLPERFGLSAALAEEGSPTVRRGAGTPVAVPAARRADGGRLAAPHHQSAPVNVPAWPERRRKGAFDVLDEEEREEEEGEEEWVPPHVMVARSHMMTFSVFEGVGRTLKGRDLRRVRNDVWRQTGFLD